MGDGTRWMGRHRTKTNILGSGNPDSVEYSIIKGGEDKQRIKKY